jgi:hypothetical protein
MKSVKKWMKVGPYRRNPSLKPEDYSIEMKLEEELNQDSYS